MFDSGGIKFGRFGKRLWLASPTMHGDELRYMKEAFDTNWMSTVGENINEIERLVAEKIGCGYAVALSSGTSALHLAVKLAGERLYGMPELGKGILSGHRVFCSDLTFCATVNPVVYEGGAPVFIDSERRTWNMDPEALERAFGIYPDVRLVVFANLYGTPSMMDELRAVAVKHGALIIEDAAESFGATYKGSSDGGWRQTGTFGDYNCISFNGNKIITGSSGGMFLTDDPDDARKIRKWSTQAREDASWYQHEETGCNYRMSNVIAGVVRGQLPYLEEHIAQKKAVYERYEKGFEGLPVSMNPYDAEKSRPNFWLSCLLIDADAMCRQARGENEACYIRERGKTCPSEILETLTSFNAEGRPVWKPLSLQPVFRNCDVIGKDGGCRARTDAYIKGGAVENAGRDIFERGVCLPSDNKMTEDEQDRVIELVRRCFD